MPSPPPKGKPADLALITGPPVALPIRSVSSLTLPMAYASAPFGLKIGGGGPAGLGLPPGGAALALPMISPAAGNGPTGGTAGGGPAGPTGGTPGGGPTGFGAAAAGGFATTPPTTGMPPTLTMPGGNPAGFTGAAATGTPIATATASSCSM